MQEVPDAVDVTSSWEPDAAPLFPGEPTEDPSGSSDQWVYVDPSSYSNPHTEAPVYTSGPQPIPSAATPATALDTAIPPQFASPPAQPPPPGTAPLPPVPPGSPDGAPDTQTDPLLADDYQPEKGDLKIKERRAWKTWQLVAAMVVAAVFGMWFNGNAGSRSGTSSGSGSTYKLPPASSPATTVPSGASSGASAASSTTTTAAGGATTTTATGGTTTTTAAGGAAGGSTATSSTVAAGPATVLIPATQLSGNWTSPAFNIAAGTWNIGWAFQCVPVPSTTPTFQIFVVDNGAAPGSTPAVTSSTGSGNSVTPQTSAGSQQIIVQTSAACRWAVKVTGFSG